LSPDALAEIYGANKTAPAPKPEPPKFKRIAGGALRAEPQAQSKPEWDEQSEQAFSRAMRMLEENVDRVSRQRRKTGPLSAVCGPKKPGKSNSNRAR
jgi:hypothetical protein